MAADGPVTREALLAYLGIDYADDPMVSSVADAAAASANAYLAGALGDGADTADPRALAVGLAVAADFYDNRALEADSQKASGAVRRLVADLCAQLRAEALARAGEAPA